MDWKSVNTFLLPSNVSQLVIIPFVLLLFFIFFLFFVAFIRFFLCFLHSWIFFVHVHLYLYLHIWLFSQKNVFVIFIWQISYKCYIQQWNENRNNNENEEAKRKKRKQNDMKIIQTQITHHCMFRLLHVVICFWRLLWENQNLT